MKFVLLVEGDTEQRVLPDFFQRWLNAKLSQRVGVQAVPLDGCGNYLARFARKAQIHLSGPNSRQVIAVIGLLDLFGPQNFYPAHLRTADERFRWGRQKLEAEVDHPRFRQFFAVHELEAWLLSDPDIFPAPLKSALRSAGSNPEAVNSEQPPAKLLSKLYREKLKAGSGRVEYKKTVDGSELFRKLDPAVAYQKCPCLKELFDEMLRLAQASGC